MSANGQRIRCTISSIMAVLLLSALPAGSTDARVRDLERRLLMVDETLQTQHALPGLKMAEAHLERANLLHQLNHLRPDGGSRVPAAEASYRRALEQLPASEPAVQVHSNLGALLLDSGRAQEALAALDAGAQMADSIGIGPQAASLLGLQFNKAKALSVLGQIKEADAAYAQVAEGSYGVDITTYAKAAAAAEVLPGHVVKQVTELLPRVAAALGAATGAGQSSAAGRHASAADEKWLAAATHTDLSWLGFGLYKALERAGDIPGAWNALTLANSAMAAVQGYDPATELHTMKTLMSVFTGPLGVRGFPDPTPIFIVGLPRSGSTLVETLLASHSRVWAAGEDTLLAPLTREVHALLDRPGADLQAGIAALGRKYVEGMRARVPTALQGPLDVSGQEATPLGTQRVARIVDKMLHNLWLVGYIQLLLPEACIVHVARHPLDAGLSCYAQPFGYHGVPWSWDLGHISAQINMTWALAEHWDRTLPGRVHTLLYEEVVAHPQQAAARLLSWCGLPWEEGVLSFHTSPTSRDRPVLTASAAQVRRPLYSSSLGRWVQYAGQLQPLRDALGGTVRRYEERLEAALTAYSNTSGQMSPQGRAVYEAVTGQTQQAKDPSRGLAGAQSGVHGEL